MVPLNPDHEADEWEVKAIKAFEAGAKEMEGITTHEGKDYYRLIRPMVAAQPCLKCHGFQGYEVGDVLGGVGIKVPMEDYRARLSEVLECNFLSHGLTWLLGMLGPTTWHARGLQSVRKRAEERTALAAAYDKLEEMVAERTSALEQSRKEAEKASQAKSKFLAGMSHELRTPLNAIIGFTSTIRQETFGPVKNEKYEEYLEDIENSGQHLLNLINDILDVSGIEEGALDLHEENISLKEVTDASIQLVKPRVDFGHITVENHVPPSLPLVFADKRRIKQVFLNLLSNGAKFTPEGGEIVIRSMMGDDKKLFITVTDNGIGMDEEAEKVSLSRFGQSDKDLDRKFEGTGLGLPLSRRLMEEHGGSLEIESKPEQGTKITITFPENRVLIN